MHTLICVTFSLPPGVRGWLRLLLVTLPGLFCLPFCFCIFHSTEHYFNSKIKALQALHDTPPLCLFMLLHMFWHKNVSVTTRLDQIHQLFHKILSINIILKSIKGHNSVGKFGKIMCISHNMDHIYQCINKIYQNPFIISKNWNITLIKGHNSIEKFRNILCASHNTAYTKFHQKHSICSQDIKWKQNYHINQGP